MAPSSQQSRRSSTPATLDDAGAAQEERVELRRGPWMVDEDLALVNYITDHGDGRWNSLARAAGLKRTGKSCRLRWLNYLRPDVKRGNFTADEQLLVLDLHTRYGNRWSKIAQHLPGRTDNEIKNYWRTRVQKHAKQLNCDANSKRFKDAMRYLWMPPHLVDAHHHRIHAVAAKQHRGAAPAADHDGYYHALSGMGLTSSSSEQSFQRKWESSSSSSAYDDVAGLCADVHAGEMPVTNDGHCWVQQEMNRAAGLLWAEQKTTAVQAVNGAGGRYFEVGPELSGWVQSFSEGVLTDDEGLWTLEDIWKTQ